MPRLPAPPALHYEAMPRDSMAAYGLVMQVPMLRLFHYFRRYWGVLADYAMLQKYVY